MRMTHRTSILKLAWILAFSLTFLGGCAREQWTYRAVTGVSVTRPFEPGSQGPLVLVTVPEQESAAPAKPDPAARMDALTPQQIGAVDRGMAVLLSRKAAAVEHLQTLRQTLSEKHPKIMEAQLDIDELNKSIDEYARNFREQNRGSATLAGGNLSAAPVETHPPQTVLVASVQRDWGSYDRSIGHTVVLFIDGTPTPGEYWLNADNSVLIRYSAYSAPARTRVGLIGSVKIISVNGNEIVADVVFRETTEADTSVFTEHPYDIAAWQIPWVVKGRRTFKITDQDDPALKKAAVQWVRGDEAKK